MEIPKRGDDGITLRAGFIAKVLSMKKRNDLHTFQGLSWMKKKMIIWNISFEGFDQFRFRLRMNGFEESILCKLEEDKMTENFGTKNESDV